MNSPAVRILLTTLFAAGLALGTVLLFGILLWPVLLEPVVWIPVLAVATVLGVLAGAVGSYDLSTGVGWLTLVIDHTWSLASRLLGAVAAFLYLFFGTPSIEYSAGRHWISYQANGTSGFGVDVLQTVGTVNIGGPGNHERVHLLQARIFGPAYLPIIVVSYIVTGLLQLLFTLVLGLVLTYLFTVRQRPYLSPPSSSAVSGVFGWIYFATPFELWAYATE